MIREERRFATRHGCSNMETHIKLVNWMSMFLRAKAVDAIDFHAQGMSFVNRRALTLGQELIISVKNHSHTLRDIPAVVRYCNQLGNGFHCGVEFLLDTQRGKQDNIITVLETIERQLSELNQVRYSLLY